MYFRIEADDHTFDKVMDEALSCGLGVFPGKVLYSDKPERWQKMRRWLGFRGIKYSPTQYFEEEIPNGSRIAYHMLIATLGRKAFSIC